MNIAIAVSARRRLGHPPLGRTQGLETAAAHGVSRPRQNALRRRGIGSRALLPQTGQQRGRLRVGRIPLHR
ncbi:hypothetical protein [Nocardia aurantiaca]|uniref:Uncharacterized protein n=1 Tax=Nocardia aurantiaca TaxID=2675850 RepID=A0A6I3KVW0_9NOCA|nr:hypothetical protein [Nocardia aurantiaca]MTE14963.1 hypothetical protein [Nocardia aurantiaca]